MDNLETNIQQLRVSVEELEKRIKAISSQVTVNTQITATKACLDEIKELILEFQDSYNEHLNYCYLSESEHMAEYQTFRDTTNSSIETNRLSIEDLSVRLDNLNQLHTSLENKVNQLEQMCIETENIANNTEIKCNDLEYKISGYDLTIEELQTNTNSALEQCSNLDSRCTSLETSVSQINTTNQNQSTDISTLQSDVSTLQSDVSTLKNNITSGLKAVQSLQETDTKHTSQIESLQNDMSNVKDNINVANTEIDNLKQVQSVLDERVNTLEANDGGTTSIASSFGSDFYREQSNQFNFNSTLYSPYFYVCCDKFSPVELQIRIECDLGSLSNYTIPITIMINGEKYIREIRSTTPGVFSDNISVPFIATKHANLCRLTFDNDMATTSLHKLNITAIGHNINLYCLNKSLNIFCFNQEYYITYRNRDNYIQYGKYSKDMFNIESISLTEHFVPNLTTENAIAPYIYPSLGNSGTLSSNSTVGQIIYICPEDNDYIHYGSANTDDGGGYTSSPSTSSYSTVCFDAIPYGISYGGFTHLYVTTEKKAYIYHTKVLSIKTGAYVSYNGENVTDCIYGTLVKNINLNLGDAVPSYLGAIITTEDEINYYYPNLDSTYRVEIAKGKNATAYLQPDGSINVYINQGTNVNKYVLRKNDESVFALCPDETITYNGYTRIEEAFDDTVFAFRFDKMSHKSISEL